MTDPDTDEAVVRTINGHVLLVAAGGYARTSTEAVAIELFQTHVARSIERYVAGWVDRVDYYGYSIRLAPEYWNESMDLKSEAG